MWLQGFRNTKNKVYRLNWIQYLIPGLLAHMNLPQWDNHGLFLPSKSYSETPWFKIGAWILAYVNCSLPLHPSSVPWFNSNSLCCPFPDTNLSARMQDSNKTTLAAKSFLLAFSQTSVPSSSYQATDCLHHSLCKQDDYSKRRWDPVEGAQINIRWNELNLWAGSKLPNLWLNNMSELGHDVCFMGWTMHPCWIIDFSIYLCSCRMVQYLYFSLDGTTLAL